MLFLFCHSERAFGRGGIPALGICVRAIRAYLENVQQPKLGLKPAIFYTRRWDFVLLFNVFF